jgi:tetratricopeptide (TPR) repeat protein
MDNNDAEKMSSLLPSLREHLYKLPERYRFHVNYIEFMLEGNIDRGEAILELWKRIFPADPVPGWYLAVNHYENSGLFRKAIKEYELLLEMQPYQGDYILKIAELNYHEGLNKQAEAQYKRYIEKFPGDIKGYHELGRFYLQTAEFEKAEEIYEKAFLLKPENVETMINLAEVRIRQGLFEKARDDLNEALYLSRTRRDSINIYDKFIYLNEQRGRNNEALQLRRKTRDMALKLDSPRQVLMERETGDIPLYIKTGDTVSAYASVENLKHLPPPYHTFYVWGKLVLAREMKDPENMTKALEEGAQKGLEKIYGYSYKRYRNYSEAMVLMLEGNFKEAGDKFLALGMTGKAPVYAAECLRKTGRIRQARKVLEDYLKYYPVEPDAHVQMALIARDRQNIDLYRYHLRVAMNVWKEADRDYRPRMDLQKLIEEEGF